MNSDPDPNVTSRRDSRYRAIASSDRDASLIVKLQFRSAKYSANRAIRVRKSDRDISTPSRRSNFLARLARRILHNDRCRGSRQLFDNAI